MHSIFYLYDKVYTNSSTIKDLTNVIKDLTNVTKDLTNDIKDLVNDNIEKENQI